MTRHHLHASDTPARTVAVAQTIVLLIQAGFLPRDHEQIAEACRIVGVTPRQVVDAAAAMPAGSRRISEATRRAIEPPDDHAARSTPKRQRSVVERAHRWTDTGDCEIRCNGGPGVCDPHWLPVDAFSPRGDRQGGPTADRPYRGRRSSCDHCHRMAQRIRYLSTSKRAAMSEAGLAFTVVDGDDMIGVVCKHCGESVTAGDRVQVDAVVYHADCHPDDR